MPATPHDNFLQYVVDRTASCYTMASGMIRSAASTVKEENSGIDSPKSTGIVSFCEEFLLTIMKGEKEIDLFDKFSLTIVDALKKSLKELPNSADAKREKVWREFHQMSVSQLPKLWKTFFTSMNLDNNQLFQQSVNMKVFQMLLKESFTSLSAGASGSSVVQLTGDEFNVMRYACGFVPHKLLKKYEAGRIKRSPQCIECLGNMAVASENEDYQSYSRHWIDIVNRGGLFPLNDQAFAFFSAVETKVRALLPCTATSQASDSCEATVRQVVEDDDVQWEWCLLSQDIDSYEEGAEVLNDIVKLWVTIRGFSLAASWLEKSKKKEKKTTKKSTGLRKQLS